MHWILLKILIIDSANLKSEVYKLHFDKLEKVPNGLNRLKSKIDKWDLDKLVHISVNLRKLSDVVINDIVKKTE